MCITQQIFTKVSDHLLISQQGFTLCCPIVTLACWKPMFIFVNPTSSIVYNAVDLSRLRLLLCFISLDRLDENNIETTFTLPMTTVFMSCMSELHWTDWLWTGLKYKGPFIKYKRFILGMISAFYCFRTKIYCFNSGKGSVLLYVLHNDFIDDPNWKMLCTERYEVWELKHIFHLSYF